MSAVLSADQKYRFLLWRSLSVFGSGVCCFVMLNPSTADAYKDDPTIRRCISFGLRLGCAELQVVNLFAYRATDPRQLGWLLREQAIGEGNDEHIRQAARSARFVICAWGNGGSLFERSREVLAIIREVGAQALALKLNAATGEPGHPLYLPADSEPFLLAA